MRTSPTPAEVGDAAAHLDARECWTLLRTADVGRLALVVDDCPEIFPVNFVVDHGTLLFRTAAGSKLAAIAPASRRVAFEVDSYNPVPGEAWSVIVKGQASEVTDIHEVFDVSELPLFPWHIAPKPHFVRIEPEQLTGRRFRVSPPRAWPR
jgi:nitroimidazol reductase NimA-like FMN-containing flavoprotein (pyridoxamine 5'-phosphate oxidase superfamily)